MFKVEDNMEDTVKRLEEDLKKALDEVEDLKKQLEEAKCNFDGNGFYLAKHKLNGDFVLAVRLTSNKSNIYIIDKDGTANYYENMDAFLNKYIPQRQIKKHNTENIINSLTKS